MKWDPLPDQVGFQAGMEPFQTQSAHLEAFEGRLLKSGVAAEDLGGQGTPQGAGREHATQIFQVCQQSEPVFCQASPQPSGAHACMMPAIHVPFALQL